VGSEAAPKLVADFASGTQKVLALLSWKCVPAGTTLAVDVYQNGNPVLQAQEHVVRQASRTDPDVEVPMVGHVFPLEWSDGAWPNGTYLATVSFDGTVDEYAGFSVGGGNGQLTWKGETDLGAIPYKAASDVLVVTNTAVLRNRLGSQTDSVLAAARRIGVLFDLAKFQVQAGDPDAAAAAIKPYLKGYGYVLILGNDDVVPYFQLKNPLSDEQVYDGVVDVPSDDPYTDLDQDAYGLPDLPTARLPSSDDAELLLTQLGDLTTPDGGAFVLLNEQREREGQAVIDAIHAGGRNVDYDYSPPLTPSQFNDRSGHDRYLYALIHGSARKTDTWWANVQSWTGPDGVGAAEEWFVDESAQEPAITLTGNPGNLGLVQVGACYGAYTLPVKGQAKTAENSLALLYLKSGARAFIADTHLSYSAQQVGGIPLGRTGFEVAFWQAINAGKAPIDAFFEAKQRIAAAAETFRKQEYVYDWLLNMKTIHYMVYLGRP